jgi:hypothetical protein
MAAATLAVVATGIFLLADKPSSTTLSPHLTPGEEISYCFTDEQTIQDQAPKVPVISSKTVSYLSLRPIERRGTGHRLLAKYDRVIVSLSQGKSRSMLDTAGKPTRRESPEMAPYREWIGREILVDVDEHGGIVNLQPADDSAPTASITAAAAHLRRHLTLLWAWLPREPLASDRTWRRKEKLSAGLVDLQRENSLRIVEQDRDQLLIEGTLRVKGEPTKGEGPEGETIIASVDHSEPGRASIVYDARQGRVLRIESAIDFHMNVTRIAKGSQGEASTAVQSSQKLNARSLVQFVPQGALPAAN